MPVVESLIYSTTQKRGVGGLKTVLVKLNSKFINFEKKTVKVVERSVHKF